MDDSHYVTKEALRLRLTEILNCEALGLTFALMDLPTYVVPACFRQADYKLNCQY